MAPQWFCLKRIADGVIVSFCTDDSAGFAAINPAVYQKLGPFADQDSAVAANQPNVITPGQTTINTLRAKTSATWTLNDVADWLKSKG